MGTPYEEEIRNLTDHERLLNSPGVLKLPDGKERTGKK